MNTKVIDLYMKILVPVSLSPIFLSTLPIYVDYFTFIAYVKVIVSDIKND